MKKKILTALLFTGMLLTGVNKVFADRFTYKVYNTKTNKTYIAVLGTISLSQHDYIWGFYTKEGTPICVINLNTNYENGLIKGKCGDVNDFMKFMNKEQTTIAEEEYVWKEFSKGTFHSEQDYIRQKLAEKGKYDLSITEGE